MKQMDEIIYYPSTRAILIQELKTALEMYEKHEMTNEQLRYLVEHYMKGFGHLMFERDRKRLRAASASKQTDGQGTLLRIGDGDQRYP